MTHATAEILPADPTVVPAFARERATVVIAGHVDHGKSTVIGRLLADTGSLPEGKLAQVEALCRRTARPFEYAFLLDALRDERAQGITIDAARVFFRSAKREYAIIDAPGHVEFVRNLVTGAARADAALLVIDAREGVQENSRRHGYLLSLLGVRDLIVLVNKMDLAGFAAAQFQAVADEYRAFIVQLGLTPREIIPVVGRDGDNIAHRSTRMSWYDGPTVLDALDALRLPQHAVGAPLRLPVQDVYRFTAQGDDRRIVAGTLATGTLRTGDRVVFLPSGKTSHVRSVEAFNRDTSVQAVAGEATGVTLEEQVYVTRGDILTRVGETPPHVADRIRVSLFWLGARPLTPDHRYTLKLGTVKVEARLETVHRVMDSADLHTTEGKTRVDRHDVAECTLVLRRPIAFDVVDALPITSRFVLVDDYQIRGGGVIREALPSLAPAVRNRREAVAGEATHGAVVWFTGLSGAGKSTIARRAADLLRAEGHRVELLDGDELRALLPDTGFSPEARDRHVRWTGILASRLERYGVVVLAALVSPEERSRQFVRGVSQRFIEVHVATSFEECERRDVKGLYARARRGELPGLTGLDAPYEPPTAPELVLETIGEDVETLAARVVGVLKQAGLESDTEGTW